jgi:hypothetical protein
MPKSTAAYFGFSGSVTFTKIFPGCMSAWKKLCRKTWVKKISTPFSASFSMLVPPAEIPVDLWHVEHLRTLEVALQLCSVAGLAHEVQFVDDRLLVLGDDFERFEALAVLPVS